MYSAEKQLLIFSTQKSPTFKYKIIYNEGERNQVLTWSAQGWGTPRASSGRRGTLRASSTSPSCCWFSEHRASPCTCACLITPQLYMCIFERSLKEGFNAERCLFSIDSFYIFCIKKIEDQINDWWDFGHIILIRRIFVN